MPVHGSMHGASQQSHCDRALDQGVFVGSIEDWKASIGEGISGDMTTTVTLLAARDGCLHLVDMYCYWMPYSYSDREYLVIFSTMEWYDSRPFCMFFVEALVHCLVFVSWYFNILIWGFDVLICFELLSALVYWRCNVLLLVFLPPGKNRPTLLYHSERMISHVEC